MNTFQLRSLGLLCLMFVLPTAARAADRDHTIRDVPYFDMRGGFCTPTVLRMNFEFHGLKVPATVLQNWSWNYGFHLNDQKRISFPTTDPVEQIEHAAAVLGYETTIHTHDSLAAATARIKSLVDQNVPAIVQWIPHSVLAVGYEGDRLLIHDPRDVLAPEEGKVFGAGAYHASLPVAWNQPPALWNIRRYLVIEMRPGRDSLTDWAAIDWAPILKRNALRTLGGRQGADWLGVAAIRQLAERPRGDLTLTGYYGWTARQNAALFLRSQANADLKQAGEHFANSAELFRQLYERDGDARRHLAQIADEEERAARLMERADAGSMTLPGNELSLDALDRAPAGRLRRE
jgi:hypothetical protein